MTPAEWLAVMILVSVVYGVIENGINPDAVTVKVNNWFAGGIRLVNAAVILVLALVVLL